MIDTPPLMSTVPPHEPAVATSLRLDAVNQWLASRLPGFEKLWSAQRMDGGQSNPSWILRGNHRTYVLRSKPAPQAALASSAHAIEREYAVLQALQDSGVPVPKTHILCEDESVIGLSFYLMDFVEGRIFRDATLPDVPPHERSAHVFEAARVMATLHQVDWRRAGLHDFGRHTGYFSRMIGRWTRQYRATSQGPQGPLEMMDRLAAWLPDHIPAGAEDAAHTCITHGDFRLENLIFHPTRPEIVAVLDWELSTLGHPLSDLAYNSLAWHMPQGLLRGYADQDLAALSLPSESEFVTHYCAHAGLEAQKVFEDWPFYLAFNLFRLGAILHGIGARARDGTASSASAHDIAGMAPAVAQWGWTIAQGLSPHCPPTHPRTPS